MEKLSRSLANKIASSLGYDSEKEAVMAYGLFAIVQIILTIVLVFLFGLLIGAPAEALITCLSASILRRSSGGVHAAHPNLCTSIGIVYCTLTAFISRKLLLNIYSPMMMAAAIIVIFGLSFLIIYKKAPVDSPNKPIKTEKKIRRMRKGSFITIAVYLCLSVLMFILGYRSDIMNSYGISLLFGVAWQSFTLTHAGFVTIDKLNNLYFLRKEAHG